MSAWAHIRSIVILPVMAMIVIPSLILYFTGDGRFFPPADQLPFPALAGVYLAIGLWLLVSTIRHFSGEGEGTLAQWNPTKQLVITGIYRRVRNPMITGVLLILLAEATLFGSRPLLIWFLVFLAVNVIYIPLSEERRLEKRFGDEYRAYKQNVPRWIPRRKPWDPDSSQG